MHPCCEAFLNRNSLRIHTLRTQSLATIAFLSALLCASSGFTADSWHKAKYAGEFTSVGVGARGLALGGAYVALAEDVTAGYWNPAGLARIEFPQLTAMHAERFAGIVNYDYLGVAFPLGQKSTVALNITRTGIDDIPITALRNPELELGEFYYENNERIRNVPYIAKMVNDAEWAWYLSYAHQKSSTLFYGANAKFVRKGVGEYSAWGLGFDVGVRWNPLNSLFLGANLQDATSTLLAWNTGERELILPTLKWGAAYVFEVPWLKGIVIPTADVDFRFEGRKTAAQVFWKQLSADFHFGLEYDFSHIVALRVGLDVGHPSAGLGVHLPKLDVDYAFLSHSDLGATHRISLRLSIEEKKFQRQ